MIPQCKRTVAVATALLVSSVAAEDTTKALAQNQRAVENLVMLGTQFKAAITPDLGFPSEYVQHWQAAVDTAFAPDLLEADFNTTLETRLSEKTREAAFVYEQSQLGQDLLELVNASQPFREDPTYLADTQEYLDGASPEERALLDQLFAAHGGAKQTEAVMDVYTRAMITAAEPIIGAEAATQWMADASYLRDGYARDHFLTHAAVFRQLPDEQLEKLLAVLVTPEMADYTEQTTEAFAKALHLAANRLDATYSKQEALQ